MADWPDGPVSPAEERKQRVKRWVLKGGGLLTIAGFALVSAFVYDGRLTEETVAQSFGWGTSVLGLGVALLLGGPVLAVGGHTLVERLL